MSTDTNIKIFHEILDELDIGIFKSDTTGKITYANQYLKNMLETSDLNSIDWLKTIIHDKEHIIITSHVNNNVYYVKKKTLTNNYTSLQDNTPLINLHKQLNEVYDNKDSFISHMSHKIKNPIGNIINLINLLEETYDLTQQQHYISLIKICSSKIIEIINDILDFTKLELGTIQLKPSSVSLKNLLQSIELIMKELTNNKPIVFKLNISADVPDTLNLDPYRLKQILLNMLSNSLRLTTMGTIEITVNKISSLDYTYFNKNTRLTNLPITCKKCGENACHLCEADATCCYMHPDQEKKCICCNLPPINKNHIVYLRFDIIDTGCGIEDDMKQKILTNLLPGSKQSQILNNGYGLGLGLSIAKHLVYLMRGVIWLDDTTLNKGSKFSFIITSENIIESVIENINEIKQDKIMILSHDAKLRLKLVNYLEFQQVSSFSVSTVEEANYFYNKHTISGIIADIRQPEIENFIKQIDYDNKKNIVVLLTNKQSPSNYKYPSLVVGSVNTLECINILKLYIQTKLNKSTHISV